MPARIPIDREKIADFCRRNHIRRLAVFGSVLRDDFGPDTDVDVLVEFEAGHVPGLAFIRLEQELSRLLGGRRVDLVTPKNRAREHFVSLSRQGKFSDERFDRVDRIDQVPPVSHWPFSVLVKVASSGQLLSDGTARHCEGLRYTRNLIHAVRAAKDAREEVTERKAETARATVRECHEDLENRLRRI